VVCIGASTAAAAAEAGLTGVSRAADATAEAIVDELVDRLAPSTATSGRRVDREVP
jgi:hypothetical protein